MKHLGIFLIVGLFIFGLQTVSAQTGNRRNIFGVSTSKNIYGSGTTTIRRNILGRKWGSNARLIGVHNIGNTRIYGIKRISFGRMFSAETGGLRNNYFGSSKKVFDSSYTNSNGSISGRAIERSDSSAPKVIPLSNAETQRELNQYKILLSNSFRPSNRASQVSGKGATLSEF